MKRVIGMVSASIAVAAVLVAPSASAAYRCDDPQGVGEQRACAKAAEGPVEVRRFVERTRGIYGLYYADFVANDERAAAQPARRLADAKPAR
jgi:hypothetical protein